jgi:hypothetical protein
VDDAVRAHVEDIQLHVLLVDLRERDVGAVGSGDGPPEPEDECCGCCEHVVSVGAIR